MASLDSPLAKVHPDGTGVRRKHGPQAIGKSRGGWTTKVHMIAANERHALAFSLSHGEVGDAPEGRKLLSKTRISAVHLVMDRAYEDDETRKLVAQMGMKPVVLAGNAPYSFILGFHVRFCNVSPSAARYRSGCRRLRGHYRGALERVPGIDMQVS